jgi:uncharacterized repeat protein (TIGR03803 family)
LDGSPKTLKYPSGDVITYAVGGAGRLTQLSDSSNNYVGYSGNVAMYAPNGSLASMTNGHTSTIAGIVTSNIYNSRLQPILLSATVGQNSLFSLCYDFHLGVAVNSTPCSTPYGGPDNDGTVFKITPTGALTVLHSFAETDGRWPGDLVQGTDGNFYGTTAYGGAYYSYGTIFAMTAAGAVTTLHSFNVTDGINPGQLIQDTNGTFYGMTGGGAAQSLAWPPASPHLWRRYPLPVAYERR